MLSLNSNGLLNTQKILDSIPLIKKLAKVATFTVQGLIIFKSIISIILYAAFIPIFVFSIYLFILKLIRIGAIFSSLAIFSIAGLPSSFVDYLINNQQYSIGLFLDLAQNKIWDWFNSVCNYYGYKVVGNKDEVEDIIPTIPSVFSYDNIEDDSFTISKGNHTSSPLMEKDIDWYNKVWNYFTPDMSNDSTRYCVYIIGITSILVCGTSIYLNWDDILILGRPIYALLPSKYRNHLSPEEDSNDWCKKMGNRLDSPMMSPSSETDSFINRPLSPLGSVISDTSDEDHNS
jgi:hypothetical protein